MPDEAETFDQLCARLAYYIMQDIARGTPAERIAHSVASQTLMWRRDHKEQESRNGR